MSVNITRKLIDIGSNLTDPMFRGIYNLKQRHCDDFDHMLNRAKSHGLDKIIITGGSLNDSRSALEISEKYENLYTTVGCHPTRCGEFIKHPKGPSAYLNQLEELIKDNLSKVVAIGEMGLDYDRTHFCPAETQKIYFEKQITLVEKFKLPMFLHNRNSIDDFIEILSKNRSKFEKSGGVVHSFDGSSQDLKLILDLGFYVGINGCSLKTESNLEVAKTIPADRLLIETDCPWCGIRQTHASYKYVSTIFQKTKDASNPQLPVKDRNEPMNLIQILEVLAAIRGDQIDSLCEQIYKNTNKLFFNK